MRRLIACAALVALGATPAPSPSASNVDWPTVGNDAGKSHYSELTQINTQSAARLGLAWEAQLGTNRGLEATPIVADGVMYTSGVAGRAYAFDAATGRKLWEFDPPVDLQITRFVCCDDVNRGVAVANRHVYVAALDGMLYALDARTGAVAWKIDTIDDHSRGISSTGAPEVAGDLVIIGNAGSDYDARGYVSAYDRETGALKWRFHIVPRDPKLGPQDHPDLDAALKTWDTDSRWDKGAGGSPWDAINYDAETGLVLIGTGNAEPYAESGRSPKGGHNLYASSLVALDAKTGRLKWYYQESPSDQWDYDACAPMILTHMQVDGTDTPVVLHAPKNGFMYVIDRRNGHVLRANRLVRVNWTSGIDPKTGEPALDPAADISTGPKIVFPATPGARNWMPGAYDPVNRLWFGSIQDMGNLMFVPPGPKDYAPKGLNTDAALIFTPMLKEAMGTLPPPVRDTVKALPAWQEVLKNPGGAELRALDPLTGKTIWSVPTAGWQDRGGALATAGGIIVQGNLAGQLRVFDARNGHLIKAIETGTSILAAPMTYSVKGVQYIAVMAAWGGGGYPYVPRYAAAYTHANEGRLLVFKLGGRAIVPQPPKLPPLKVADVPPPQAAGVTPTTISQGRALFYTVGCALCHANQARSITPDLRRMAPETHKVFDEIVLRGLYVPAGMPRWDDVLKPADAAAIHAWLIDEQAKTRSEDQAKIKRHIPLDAPSLAILSNY